VIREMVRMPPKGKIKCPRCGGEIEVPLRVNKPLQDPRCNSMSVLSDVETIRCAYCGFVYSFIPYTVEEATGYVSPTCLYCGKPLNELDEDLQIVAIYTREDPKPTKYEFAGYRNGEEIYRKIREEEPEKIHKYFFCSIDCYYVFLDLYGFAFKGTLMRIEV